MPRRPRLRRRSSGWTEEQIAIAGGEPEIFESFQGDDERRECWFDLRDGLLPRFIEFHPGHRPHFWWGFESPGRRERIDGRRHPFDDRTFDLPKDLHFGIPRCWRLVDIATLPGANLNNIEQAFESERAFLVRLSLLTAGE